MNYIILSKTELFRGMSEEEIKSMLQCLQAHRRTYARGQFIYRTGDSVDSLGLVLSGSVNIENDDVWGNRNIINNVAQGQVFAETYACVPGVLMMVSVVATETTEALFLNMDRVLKTCSSACAFHGRLIRNLLSVTAQKNLHLTRKIYHTAPKSIRGKLLSYLSDQAIAQGPYQFQIPFNRQQLADYLGVDRSAMSSELSKMSREGLLEYKKNSFSLNKSISEGDW